MFDYEKILFDVLDEHRHLWVKKGTGLGVTEFMLRYMAWLCLSNITPQIAGSQMCIVTGPRIELAITLIDRMKSLFGANDGCSIHRNCMHRDGIQFQGKCSNFIFFSSLRHFFDWRPSLINGP